MEANAIRIVFSATFIMIAELGLSKLYGVCNHHFDQIDIKPQSRHILNSLSHNFTPHFSDVRREALQLLGDRDRVYCLLACNIVNIELGRPLMEMLDKITSNLDVVSVVVIRLRKGIQMSVPGVAFHGLLKYYVVLEGDSRAHVTTHSTSHVLTTGSSFILDSSVQMHVTNGSDIDLIILCLEISKPFVGYDEMINVIAMQCISSHKETLQKCLEIS